MDAKLPMDIFENVMQLAIEGCKAIANYIREVRTVSFRYIITFVHLCFSSKLYFFNFVIFIFFSWFHKLLWATCMINIIDASHFFPFFLFSFPFAWLWCFMLKYRFCGNFFSHYLELFLRVFNLVL